MDVFTRPLAEHPDVKAFATRGVKNLKKPRQPFANQSPHSAKLENSTILKSGKKPG